MSQTVRAEVSPQSQEWGYSLGSVYIRKVHFRDAGMIKQIEEKVVNRLRQVTVRHQAGRRQPGQHHHQHGGAAGGDRICQGRRHAPAHRRRGLQKISQDPDISHAMFDILETQNIIEGQADITLMPNGNDLLKQLAAANEPRPKGSAPTAKG